MRMTLRPGFLFLLMLVTAQNAFSDSLNFMVEPVPPSVNYENCLHSYDSSNPNASGITLSSPDYSLCRRLYSGLLGSVNHAKAHARRPAAPPARPTIPFSTLSGLWNHGSSVQSQFLMGTWKETAVSVTPVCTDLEISRYAAAGIKNASGTLRETVFNKDQNGALDVKFLNVFKKGLDQGPNAVKETDPQFGFFITITDPIDRQERKSNSSISYSCRKIAGSQKGDEMACLGQLTIDPAEASRFDRSIKDCAASGIGLAKIYVRE